MSSGSSWEGGEISLKLVCPGKPFGNPSPGGNGGRGSGGRTQVKLLGKEVDISGSFLAFGRTLPIPKGEATASLFPQTGE